MSHFIKIISASLLVFLVGAGCTTPSAPPAVDTPSTDDISAVQNTEPVDQPSTTSIPRGEEAATPGNYEVYAPEKVARAADGDVVLFFRASWCPTCRILDTDLRANLEDIPSNLTILDVNYDTETELKQRYGVTYQHTLIQVDAEGNQIARWSGGSTLTSVIEKLK